MFYVTFDMQCVKMPPDSRGLQNSKAFVSEGRDNIKSGERYCLFIEFCIRIHHGLAKLFGDIGRDQHWLR